MGWMLMYSDTQHEKRYETFLGGHKNSNIDRLKLVVGRNTNEIAAWMKPEKHHIKSLS